MLDSRNLFGCERFGRRQVQKRHESRCKTLVTVRMPSYASFRKLAFKGYFARCRNLGHRLLSETGVKTKAVQSSSAGKVSSTSAAVGRLRTGSSLRILPSRKTSTRLAK